MGLIEDAIKVAREFYDDEKYYHAMRVAAYVVSDNIIPHGNVETCVALAIMHDLQEDTEFDYNNNYDFATYNSYINTCLNLLTRDKENQSYEDYLKDIRDKYNSYPEVYWVKKADIKDHLVQKETLTDELKEKYLKALPCLL